MYAYSARLVLHSAVAPIARLAPSRFRSEDNQANALVRFVAGPGMGYGADIAPLLCHAEATAMRAACVQMCHAIECVPVWSTPAAAVTRLDLSSNAIGNAGAVAMASVLQVHSFWFFKYVDVRFAACLIWSG